MTSFFRASRELFERLREEGIWAYTPEAQAEQRVGWPVVRSAPGFERGREGFMPRNKQLEQRDGVRRPFLLLGYTFVGEEAEPEALRALGAMVAEKAREVGLEVDWSGSEADTILLALPEDMPSIRRYRN